MMYVTVTFWLNPQVPHCDKKQAGVKGMPQADLFTVKSHKC